MTNYKINVDLVSENVKNVKREILSRMEETDKLILDFSETNYVDSIGLGMLVSIYKESIKENTELKTENVNENIKKLFRITALDGIFLTEN
ncbi:MAG: STAS domain-containing protein [Bacillota bacterium]|nr:STAS domain-containing protein [Bacillota bacterium]